METRNLLTLLLITCALWSCASTPAGPYGYTHTYLHEQQHCSGSMPPDEEDIDRFMAFYNKLAEPDVDQRIQPVYAEDLYFNDTLITLRSRDDLAAHLRSTGKKLDSMSVTLLNVLKPSTGGNPATTATFLLWEMEVRFTLLGKQRLSHTLGISQLCFNGYGQVVFQQDFWDSSQGLDQHLPLLGPPTRWLRQHDEQP